MQSKQLMSILEIINDNYVNSLKAILFSLKNNLIKMEYRDCKEYFGS